MLANGTGMDAIVGPGLARRRKQTKEPHINNNNSLRYVTILTCGGATHSIPAGEGTHNGQWWIPVLERQLRMEDGPTCDSTL